MSSLNERQNEILKHLKENRTANVKALAKMLYVSEATIRRDLKIMHGMGLAERNHGGALLPENADEVSMFFRMEKNAKEKELIATKAIEILPEFRSVFIDSSSTALALAERLNLGFKTVVTNGLQTALQLSKKADINLLLLGGNIQYSTNAATGSFTTRQLSQLTFDLTLCSCAAVTAQECFERSIEQAELKRTAFIRSKAKILLTDSSKFSAFGTYSTATLTDFDYVVTDKKPNIKYDCNNLIF